MKKVACVIMMLLCGVAFMNCSAKKHTKKQTDMERQIDSVKMAIMIDSLKMELEKVKANEKLLQTSEPLNLKKEVPIPCAEYKTNDEYYYVLGICEDGYSMAIAVQQATLKAHSELLRTVDSGLKTEMVEQVCRKVTRDIYGNWSAYVSIRYPKNKQ